MVNIRRRIDEWDYYLLIAGSRYGLLMPSASVIPIWSMFTLRPNKSQVGIDA